MKSALNGHVDEQRHVMFQRSADEVRSLLQQMVRTLQQTLDERADEVFLAMRRDYRSVLGGGDLPQGELLPKAQRLMRKEVMDKINRAERIFKRVAGLEVEDDADEEGEDVLTGHGDKMDDVTSITPDTMDRKGDVYSHPTTSQLGHNSASADSATVDSENQDPVTEDIPIADAPIAATEVKLEANDPATTDNTSSTIPAASNDADTAVTPDPNPNPNQPATPTTKREQDQRQASPAGSAWYKYELFSNPSAPKSTDFEASEIDELKRKPKRKYYTDSEGSESDYQNGDSD